MERDLARGMKRRAVITGMGTINPLGDTLEGFYQNLISGKSGIRRWQSLDMSNIECKIGGDLGHYDCLAALNRYEEVLGPDTFKKAKKIFRSTTFSAKAAVLCTLAAWQDAGLFGTGGIRGVPRRGRSFPHQRDRGRAQSELELHP